ncbi:MAG: hypothetical protein GY713_15165 [Actinomycetia bacterium]|nr:hypothetical protein [Actinomycetes bacterium]
MSRGTPAPRPPRTRHLSRRALLAGTGAGAAWSLLPMPALAGERTMVVDSRTLVLDGMSVAAPAGGSVDLGALRPAVRLPPMIEGTPFRMIGVSWHGQPGTARVRASRSGAWGPWQTIRLDVHERPGVLEGGALDRPAGDPVWVDQADGWQLELPADITNAHVHLLREDVKVGLDLDGRAAEGAPFVNLRGSWGAREPAEEIPFAADLELAIVHHSGTASHNSYGATDVPALIRGVQAFHLDANGWWDIAYNFVIDRFGRIWEARFGGVDRLPIGGHARGFNTGAMGVVLLGDYNTVSPDGAGRDLDALERLLYWKFAIHGISATGRVLKEAGEGTLYEGGEVVDLPVVAVHRMMAITACPGENLAPRIDQGLVDRTVDYDGIIRVAAGPGRHFYTLTDDGAVFGFAGARHHGSMRTVALNRPVTNMAVRPDGDGYWLVASDGGVFTFGAASFHGSTADLELGDGIVGIAPTATGRGYWLVASDGGVFAFGDARFHGSMGGVRLNQPVIGISATPSGQGYWLFASDGGVFAFGDATFMGSTGATGVPTPAVDVGIDPSGQGYWLVTADGTVHAFGVPHMGDASETDKDGRVVGMAVTETGAGYWLVSDRGTTLAYGDAI